MKPFFLLSWNSLIALTGFTACNFLTDATGKWSGSASHNGTYGEPNCHVELDITQDERTLTFHSISRDCGSYSSHWRPGSFALDNTTAWKDGHQVGYVHGEGSGRIELREENMDERYPAPSPYVKLIWSRKGDFLDFTEETEVGGQTRILSGRLQRIR